MKTKIIDFDIDRYKNGNYISLKTNCGYPAAIYRTDCKDYSHNKYVIHGFYSVDSSDYICRWSLRGISDDSFYDLKMVVTDEPKVGDYITFPIKTNRVIGVVKRIEKDNTVLEYNGVEYQIFDKSLIMKATGEEIVLFKYHSGDMSKFEVLEFLCHRRDEYNQGWKPDYTKDYVKYIIIGEKEDLAIDFCSYINSVFSFRYAETRDKFYEQYHDLLKEIIELI